MNVIRYRSDQPFVQALTMRARRVAERVDALRI